MNSFGGVGGLDDDAETRRMIAAVVAWPPLINRAARVLSRRREMADLLVGVTGDFVPARAVLNVRYLSRLFLQPVPRG